MKWVSHAGRQVDPKAGAQAGYSEEHMDLLMSTGNLGPREETGMPAQ